MSVGGKVWGFESLHTNTRKTALQAAHRARNASNACGGGVVDGGGGNSYVDGGGRWLTNLICCFYIFHSPLRFIEMVIKIKDVQKFVSDCLPPVAQRQDGPDWCEYQAQTLTHL